MTRPSFINRAVYLFMLSGLMACTAPVTTVDKKVTIDDNTLRVTSGTLSKGHFVSVDNTNTQKTWEGELAGGKEKWTPRSDFLYAQARKEIEDVCGEWFFALNKAPLYNMLDSDETMGGAAPALGVTVAMAAYLVAEAQTKDTNIPTGVYIEFSCESDKK